MRIVKDSSMASRRKGRPILITFVLAVLSAAATGLVWQVRDLWIREDRIEGFARIIDGDSLFVGKTEVRLYGVDAPELMQRCQREGRDVPCGREALRNLVALVGGQPVFCEKKSVDRFQRVIARCTVDNVDLAQAMVNAGHAVAFGHYLREEEAAKAERKGLWAGEFMRPQDWRRQESHHADFSR